MITVSDDLFMGEIFALASDIAEHSPIMSRFGPNANTRENLNVSGMANVDDRPHVAISPGFLHARNIAVYLRGTGLVTREGVNVLISVQDIGEEDNSLFLRRDFRAEEQYLCARICLFVHFCINNPINW